MNSKYCIAPLAPVPISEVIASTLLIWELYVKVWLVTFPKLLVTLTVFVPLLNALANSTVASVPALLAVYELVVFPLIETFDLSILFNSFPVILIVL